MSRRRDAERIFGRELVAAALADPTPTRTSDTTFGAFLALAREHAGDDLPTFALVVSAWLSTLEPPERLAVVRTVAGGVAGELADVARSERRKAMH